MKIERQLTSVAQQIIQDHVKHDKELIAVDATVGNGNDTLFLANLVGEQGCVYGFDVQKIAAETTYQKLYEHNLYQRVELILDTHAKIDNYVTNKIDVAMFNLGYLPGGDKSLITNSTSTTEAIYKTISQLNSNGILTILCYPGHPSGDKEAKDVYKLLQQYSPKKYLVSNFNIINTRGVAPILYIIIKTS